MCCANLSHPSPLYELLRGYYGLLWATLADKRSPNAKNSKAGLALTKEPPASDTTTPDTAPGTLSQSHQ